MTTIDYKQKIKDYMNSSEVDTLYKSMLNNLFPELKESEDERIRKAIKLCLDFVFTNNNTFFEVTKEQCLAWLEKQQKPTWSEEDEKQLQHAMLALQWYAGGTDIIDWLKKIKDILQLQPKQEWSEDDEQMLTEIVKDLQVYKSREISRDAKDAYQNEIDWLKSLKDRVQPKPKQEWSEEDDQYLLVCKNALEKYQASDKWDARIISRWLENKLKAPQTTWKPSDEQMGALWDSIKHNLRLHPVLKSLYQDLKKLKGE